MGKLLIDGELFAYTLEDKYRGQNCSDKVQNETCIPYGTYRVILSHSAHFDKILPEILDVPCFAGLRVHGGNDVTATDGCVLIGANTNAVDKIWNCAPKVDELIERLQGQDATLEIVSETPLA